MAHLDFAVLMDSSTTSWRDLISLCLRHRCGRALFVDTGLPESDDFRAARILLPANVPLDPCDLAEHISGNTAIICASQDIMETCRALLEEKSIPTLLLRGPSTASP